LAEAWLFLNDGPLFTAAEQTAEWIAEKDDSYNLADFRTVGIGE